MRIYPRNPGLFDTIEKWPAHSRDFSRESAGFRFPIQGEDSIIDRTMREKEVCGNETRRSGGSIERKNCAN